MLWSLYLSEKKPVPTEFHRAGLNFMGIEKSLAPTGIRKPELPARSLVTTSTTLTLLLIVKGISITYLANTLYFNIFLYLFYRCPLHSGVCRVHSPTNELLLI